MNADEGEGEGGLLPAYLQFLVNVKMKMDFSIKRNRM